MVQVVAVGGPDAVAEPHARVAARGPGPVPATTTRRSSAGLADGGTASEACSCAALGQDPGSQQRGVVVARDHDHLPIGSQARGRALAAPARPPPSCGGAGGASARPCHRAGRGGRRRRRARRAALPDLGQAQHVVAAAVAEVQIGDDQRAHGGAR